MNQIDQLFQNKTSDILSVYFTAGFPELNDTGLIIKGLEDAGTDLVEIGFPFSDPVADGPVIQASSHRALENGMNLDILFEQLMKIRDTIRIPKILMGYFNTVYQYGVGNFIHRCKECHVSGVIIPDLPAEVYEAEYKSQFESAGIHFICLVSPQTPPDRAAWLESISRGFIYRLSMSSTTGKHLGDDFLIPLKNDDESNNISKNKLPTLIGFGIHDHRTFAMACKQSNGAIIGTEFIRRLTKDEGRQDFGDLCRSFINEIKGIA